MIPNQTETMQRFASQLDKQQTQIQQQQYRLQKQQDYIDKRMKERDNLLILIKRIT